MRTSFSASRKVSGVTERAGWRSGAEGGRGARGLGCLSSCVAFASACHCRSHQCCRGLRQEVPACVCQTCPPVRVVAPYITERELAARLRRWRDCAGRDALTLELGIEHAQSLKDRRQVVRSMKDRLRHGFNVSVAEMDEAAGLEPGDAGGSGYFFFEPRTWRGNCGRWRQAARRLGAGLGMRDSGQLCGVGCGALPEG